MTILITGGKGMIGKAFTKALLEKNYTVIIVTRSLEKQTSVPGLKYANWNIRDQTIDADAIAEADHIIHLAGAGVADKRWTAKRKKEIVNSRVKSGELLIKALKEIPNKVRTVISASGIGWYGPDLTPSPSPKGKESGFVENDPSYNDFLGQTCKQWEGSLDPLLQIGKRLVKLRTGIVLSKEGGALKEFEKVLRFGIAAILGNGKQVMSWIHIDDLVRIYIMAIENEKIKGVYNAVAPYPVINKKLVLTLAEEKKGKFFVPVYVPSFVLKMVLGEMSIEVLKSVTVSGKKIHDAGFVFQYPHIEAAFKNLYTD